MLHLLNEIIERTGRGERLAVCTLVRTRGSTPQKAGAMLLVLTDGKTLGTIGGGCVEAEVRTRALRLISQPADRLFTFKLDHDLGWDDGLVCGGVMDVAVQVIDGRSQAEQFLTIRDQLLHDARAELRLSVLDESDQAVHFLLPFEPIPTLVIAGAGHVGAALAAIAVQLEFSVIVIDDRAEMVSTERFPHASLRIGPVESELGKLELNARSHVVIVTRGHRRDASALAAVVRSNASYIGLIGSQRKILKIFSELQEQGIEKEELSRVRAPIGLDIGAVTPGEIAVSIAAELIAARRRSHDAAVMPMRLSRAQVDRL